ncbi:MULTISPECIES: hypothetical protein [Clostridium]|nr:hypothetical protein [Clostridium massiliamazoniense]
MYAFYVARGWKLHELANLDIREKLFLYHSQNNFYKEEAEKYKALFGSK